MKITKFVHSCLLVEMPAPVNRTVLFDPGVYSQNALNVDSLEYLDDIVITHVHGDHLHMPLLEALVAKFPDVRITAPHQVVDELAEHDIKASAEVPDGMQQFDSPHESVEPMFPRPENLGIHYLGKLTVPGDSHSFKQTMPILALPVSGPWASTIKAINLAIELKPKYVLPVHDWHWSDAAREQMYGIMRDALAKEGIEFVSLVPVTPVVLHI